MSNTIRFPQRNLSPEASAWAQVIERELQALKQQTAEQSQATQRALGVSTNALRSSLDLGLELEKVNDQVQDALGAAGGAEEEAASKIVYSDVPPMDEVDTPSGDWAYWYVVDEEGNILEVWSWEDIDGDGNFEWVRQFWAMESFSDEVNETLTNAVTEAEEAKRKAVQALEDAFAAQGGVQGALENIKTLDERLTPQIESAQTAADAAAQDASQAKNDAQNAYNTAMASVNGSTIEYALSTSRTTPPTSGWTSDTVTPSGSQVVWVRTKVSYANGTSSYSSPSVWTGPEGAKGDKGDTGADGLPGKDGVGVTGTTIQYTKSTSGTTAPSSGWQNTVPTATPGQYLWTRTVWTYSDKSTETGYSVSQWGAKGADGSDGIAGKDGVGITKTDITYAQSTSGTTPPTTGWAENPPTPIAGRYIWTRTVWTYSDATTETGYSVGKIGNTGAKGDKGDTGADGLPGKDGIGLKSTTIQYAKSTSGTTAPTSDWQSTVPTSTPGQYLWTRTVWTYTDSSTETAYSVSQWGATGASGSDGIAGKDGVGIDSTTITYTQSTSGTTPPTSGWQSAPPTAVAGRYIWTKTVWKYTDGTTETGYSVGKIGDTGAKGDKGAAGDKGDTGVSVLSVIPYYRLLASKPAQPSGASPSGWSTAEPAPDFALKLWRADRVALSNGTYQWTSVTQVSAYTAAGLAMTAADGKSSIHYGSAAPSNPKKGDRWYNSANGKAQIWSGSAWRDTTPGEGFVPTLDIGRATVGDLEVGRLKAQTTEFSTAVIDTLVGQNAFVESMYANKIVVGGGTNIQPDPGYSHGNTIWGTTAGGTGSGFSTDHVFPGGLQSVKMVQKKAGTSNMSLYAPVLKNVSDNPRILTPVVPGQMFTATTEWYATAAFPTGGTTSSHGFDTRVYFYDVNGALISGSGGNQTAGRVSLTGHPVGEWFTSGGTIPVKAPATAAFAIARPTLYFPATITPNAAVAYVGYNTLRLQASSVLIENGAVTANKITASKELSAKVAQFLEVETGKITWKNATGNNAFIKSLVGEQAFFERVLANRILVSSGNMVPGTPEMGTEPHAALNGTFLGTTGGNTLGKVWQVLFGDGTDGTYAGAMSVRSGYVAECGVDGYFDCEGGTTYGFVARIAAIGSFPSGVTRGVRFYVGWRDRDNNHVSAAWSGAATNFSFETQGGTVLEWEAKAPVGAVSFYLAIQKNFWSNGILFIKSIEVRPQAQAVLIEDGAITAQKIKANAITAEKIKAKEISGDKIKAGALDAFQITSPVIQSVSTANRGIKWNGNNLVAYNDKGNETLRIAGATGSISLVGNIRSNVGGVREVRVGNISSTEGAGMQLINQQGARIADFRSGTSAANDWGISFYDDNQTATRGTQRLFLGSKPGSATGVYLRMWDNQGRERVKIDDENTEGVKVSNISGQYTKITGSNIRSTGVYANTSTNGANLWISSGGVFFRSTSLSSAKLDIREISDEVNQRILNLRVVDWIDRGETERAANARELAQLHAEGAISDDAFKRMSRGIDIPTQTRRIPGVTVEDVLEAGLDEFVDVDAEGKPSGVMYDRLALTLIPLVKRMRQEIDNLKEQINTQ